MASVASSTDSLQGVDQESEVGATGNSSIAVASISVSYFLYFILCALIIINTYESDL